MRGELVERDATRGPRSLPVLGAERALMRAETTRQRALRLADDEEDFVVEWQQPGPPQGTTAVCALR